MPLLLSAIGYARDDRSFPIPSFICFPSGQGLQFELGGMVYEAACDGISLYVFTFGVQRWRGNGSGACHAIGHRVGKQLRFPGEDHR